MNAPQSALSKVSWTDLNRRWLTQELAKLAHRLDPDESNPAAACEEFHEEFEPALQRCAAVFGLSSFERELLLLAVGVELDRAVRERVMRANRAANECGATSQPTFSLAFSALATPHWDALSPESPLRRWKLIELDRSRPLALQPMFVDERILHFITGVWSLDEKLAGIVRVVRPAADADPTDYSRRIARFLDLNDGCAPLVILTQDRGHSEALASVAKEALSVAERLGLWIMAQDLPADPADLFDLALRIDRESSLIAAVPVIELGAHAETREGQEQHAATLLAHLLSPAIVIGTSEPIRLTPDRRIFRVDLPGRAPFEPHSQARSHRALSDPTAIALRPALEQFHLDPIGLAQVTEHLATEAPSDESQPELDVRVWQACREGARGGLETLAQRIETRARFEDLVLPPTQLSLLKEIAQHLRHRRTVYGEWGMSGKTVRGHGLCVLFTGESGTGKTLAAEAIANEAMLDVYRIDLASIVSKYIGETEKNLKRLFDAAETSGAVLLFDEADALYGKRSDVKDSHDRYANIEVAYLLQRVEAYRGLAILTTNFRSALDRAFLRRIRFVVQFPFPDPAAREKIWRRELPESAPLERVDFPALARMQLSGGHIRSVALNAAFMAAADGESISMRHLRHAAQREAAKLERPLSEVSKGVWE